jgi:ArpU family phage transcriptional regulator
MRSGFQVGALKTAPKSYRKQVEDVLRKYPLYKQALRFRLFPSLTMDYSVERVDGGESEYQSSTEKYGIIRIEYRELVEQVEMVLSLLSDDERNLIKETYFKIDSPPIDIIYERLCISRRSYFRIKQQALIKIATMLRIEEY